MERKYSETDERNLKLLVVMSRCMQSVQRKEFVEFKQQGITISRFAVMEMLYHKGDMCINSIIEKMLSSSGNVTVVIDNLEKDGYVERRVSSEDRRKKLIHLTEKGTKIIEDIFPKHINNLEEMFSVLEEKEKDVLIKLMKKLGRSI